MLWRWRNRKITFFLLKPHSFAAAHNLSSLIDYPTDNRKEPHKSFPLKTYSNQQQLNHTPRTIPLTPQSVQSTLRNCPSDLIALRFFMWCAQQPHYFHDKPTFQHMVNVVSNLTQRHGTVKRIVQELETVGCVTKAQTLLLLMRIYWCGAVYDMVFESFEEMRNYGYVPNTYARNIVMDVLFRIGNIELGLKVLEDTQSPNFLSFNIAVCNLCRLDDVENVKSVLRRMLMKGYYLNPETYSLVLICLCKFARLDEALQLLGLMIVSDAPINVNIWSILINGFCKNGEIEFAAYLLEIMIWFGFSPNIVTWTSLIKGFLESNMPGKAFEILSNLESRGCFPDLVLCNVLINSLSKMGWYNDAFEVFSSLRERKLVPDVYTFSSLVSTICLSKQYVLLPLLTSGLAIQPDLIVCNCLLSYFSDAGFPEGAIEFYNDMIDRGFTPDKYSYAAVLTAMCRLGRIHEAFKVYIGMIRSNLDIDAHIHTIIINALLKSGSFHEALRLIKKGTFILDVVSYNVSINGLLKNGRLEEAYNLFSQMKKMNIDPDKRLYNLIVSGFCKFYRDVEMVNSILQEMVDRNIELDDYTCKLMRNSGFLPTDEHLFLVDRQDSTASSDDLSDGFVSVG